MRGYLTFEDSTARFRMRNNTGQIQLFSAKHRVFPSGLLPLVLKAAPEAGVTVDVVDARAPDVAPDDTIDTAWLRDYQVEAVLAAERDETGIIWGPTGLGKTEIAVALGQRIQVPWLFLAHRAQLAIQAAERYELRTGERAGVIGDSEWREERFTCATFQSLHAALKAGDERASALLKRVHGVIADECHVVPSATFYHVLMATSRARWRIGLSGTPLARGDQRSVYSIASLGPIIIRIRAERLIEAGMLSRPTVHYHTCKQSLRCIDWATAKAMLIVRSAQRNALLVDIACKADKPSLLFVHEIDHGKHLRDALVARGVRTGFVSGTDSIDTRKEAIAALERREFDTLVTTVVFQEGVDIPALASVVMGAGGKSTIAALQRAGRAMRVVDGKTTCEIYDIMDLGNKWLTDHSRQRRTAYVREGYEVLDAA